MQMPQPCSCVMNFQLQLTYFPLLNLICIGDHIVGDADGFEMCDAAADLVGFGVAEFEEFGFFDAFGFADHVDGIVIVFDDCPVWDVFANGSFDEEFVGQFEEEFDVCTLIELLGKFVFNNRTVDNIFM